MVLSVRVFLIFIIVIPLSHSLCAQSCITNTLSSSALAGIPKATDKCKWAGSSFGNLADVYIIKTGDGPEFCKITEKDGNGTKGIWIGKNNGDSDYSDITIGFSKSIVSLSFIIAALNNDEAGEEAIQNIRVYDSLKNDITPKVQISWNNTPSCGMKEADPKATSFDVQNLTITASKGYCCNKASGRLTITSTIPFASISFRHQEKDFLLSAANGIIISGDMTFCIKIPEPPKVKTETNVSIAKKSISSSRTKKNKKTQHKTLIQSIDSLISYILFYQSKAILKETSYPKLDQLIKILEENPKLKIVLEGHTDNNGHHELNLKLSEQRVETVKAYLVDHGINEERIQTQGYGGTQPLVPNTSNANRAKNRRVTFKIIE